MRAALAMAFAGVWMAGCAHTQEPEPPLTLPAHYAAVGGDTAASVGAPAGARDNRWWRSFGDSGLDRLEKQALAGNFTLGAAWARLEQAHATLEQAKAPRWFRVDPQASATVHKGPSFFGSTTTYNLSASVPVTYEVDWFAKYKDQADATSYDTMAARADAEAAAMTLSANVAEAWYDLVEARAQEKLLEKQIDTNQKFLELTQLRFQQGLTSALDVQQQRQQVAATQAQLDQVKAQTRVAQNQLAVLVGAVPSQDEVAPSGDALPHLPPLPKTGVPADLLVNRPDVRAAMRRVQAADSRVTGATADRLPSLMLNGSIGYAWQHVNYPQSGGGGFSLPSTTKGPEYSAGATFSVPLFDGFQGRAQQDLDRAQLHEAMTSYGQTVQQAVLEVQNALAEETEQHARIDHLKEQLSAANDALETARDRYKQGLTDFLNVLTALQAQQQADLNVLFAERQLLSYRIQLYRALGGAWTRDLEPQAP